MEAECAGADASLHDPRGLAALTRLEQCAYESIRLAQRSLTLRKVLRPCRVDTGAVTYTFGHGRHACVGERFATAAIKVAVARHLAALELTPRFTAPTPPPGQMGAVARAAEPCVVAYRRRDHAAH